MPNRFALTVCALCLLLAGCGKGAEQPTGKAVGAQVLPGTVSDAMLDLDQSRSQPLLAPPPRAVDAASEAASEAPSEAPAEAEPAKSDSTN